MSLTLLSPASLLAIFKCFNSDEQTILKLRRTSYQLNNVAVEGNYDKIIAKEVLLCTRFDVSSQKRMIVAALRQKSLYCFSDGYKGKNFAFAEMKKPGQTEEENVDIALKVLELVLAKVRVVNQFAVSAMDINADFLEKIKQLLSPFGQIDILCMINGKFLVQNEQLLEFVHQLNPSSICLRKYSNNNSIPSEIFVGRTGKMLLASLDVTLNISEALLKSWTENPPLCSHIAVQKTQISFNVMWEYFKSLPLLPLKKGVYTFNLGMINYNSKLGKAVLLAQREKKYRWSNSWRGSKYVVSYRVGNMETDAVLTFSFCLPSPVFTREQILENIAELRQKIQLAGELRSELSREISDGIYTLQMDQQDLKEDYLQLYNMFRIQ